MTLPNNALTLNLADTTTLVTHCVNVYQPVLMLSEPGMAKTALGFAIAKATNRRLFYFSGVVHEPTDLRFVMGVDPITGQARFTLPEFFTYQQPSILLVDEVSRSLPMMQNALLQVIRERRAGDNLLPDPCAIIAASNYAGDGGGSGKIISALGNRTVNIDLKPDPQGWLKWADTVDPNTNQPNIKPEVQAFIAWRPELLHKFNKDEISWPSYRTWEFVSKTLNPNLPPTIERALINGSVGQAACLEFWGFLDMYRKLASIVNIQNILNDPQHAPIPTEVSTQYAVASALNKMANSQNISAIITYMSRMPKEFETFTIRCANDRDSTLDNVKSVTDWKIANQGVM